MRSTPYAPTDRLGALCRGGRLLGALLLGAILLLPATAWSEDEKGDEKKPEAEAKKDDAKPAAPKLKPILPDIAKDPKSFRPLVDAARQYFDLDEEQWKGRSALVGELEKQAAEGRYFLKDMDALRWLVYEGRSFEPQLSDRKWQKTVGIDESKKLGGTVHWIKSQDLTIVYSVPKKYWKLKDFRNKSPRPAPYPLLVTLHDKRDYSGEKYAGDVLLKRRWPKKSWGELYEKWLVLCPIAAAGNYLEKSGIARDLVFKAPLAEFWRHYHVDFDRIILDGTEQAYSIAAAMPVFFGGLILRGKWTLEDEADKELIKNLSPVPVYVVNNPALAKQLEEGGHEQVTAGVGGKTLMKWMDERRRVVPKKFSWTVQPSRFDQVLPYWLNLDSPNWSAPKRELHVEVVDTEKEPNTVRIKSQGINTLSLFLNDHLVDLDRKVRVDINGHIEFDDKIKLVDPRMESVGRDFDFLFNREPVRIRTSMFFGWLRPARIVSIGVREPRKKEPPKDAEKKDEGPKATQDQIDRAARLLQKAKIYVEKGNKEKAIEWLKKVLELPETEHHAEARKLLKGLE